MRRGGFRVFLAKGLDVWVELWLDNDMTTTSTEITYRKRDAGSYQVIVDGRTIGSVMALDARHGWLARYSWRIGGYVPSAYGDTRDEAARRLVAKLAVR